MKKILSLLLVLSIIIAPLGSLNRAFAADQVQAAPSAPTAPSTPSTPETPNNAPSTPSIPSTPGAQGAQGDSSQAGSDQGAKKTNDQNQEQKKKKQAPTENQQPSPQTSTAPSTAQGGGNVGNTMVGTGDANNQGTILTTGNNNLESGALGGLAGSGVANTGSGAGSNNSSGSSNTNASLNNQNNTATVNNGMSLGSNSGSNTSLGNVGDTTLSTGNANVSGTAITAVNTNVDGVAVAQFDVVDNQKGDLVLDFAKGCVSGCSGLGASASNTGNGANSTNAAYNASNVSNASFQNNDAGIGNNMTLTAKSGNNNTSLNTGGNTIIQTGGANVDANMLTFANNNLAGNVLFGVVNIYGNLEGDIILPDAQVAGCTNTCGSQSGSVGNVGNGSGSTNNANNASSLNNATFQNNDAAITNNLVFDAASGNNDVNRNTGGDNSVQTGNTSVDANVLNIANSNISGGTWWLVLVNEAGNWVGKILGPPDGSTAAGSAGTVLTVGPNGEITASNGSNGSGSTNTANTSSTTNNTTSQKNSADINNTLHLTANTGGNKANDNTGGSSTIKTGDANIIANLVNFVNNNISGNGKLVVTVVNVFGSWIGDFVSPGQKKEPKRQNQVASNNSNSSNSGGDNHTQNGSSSNNGSSTSNPSPAQAESITTQQGSSHSAPSGSQSLQTGNGSAGSTVGTITNANTAVLGQSTTVTNGSKSNRIKVNLAWLVLALPFVLLLKTRKKVKAKLLSLKK